MTKEVLIMCGWDLPEEENNTLLPLVGKKVKDAYCLKPYKTHTEYVIEFEDGAKIRWVFADGSCNTKVELK